MLDTEPTGENAQALADTSPAPSSDGATTPPDGQSGAAPRRRRRAATRPAGPPEASVAPDVEPDKESDKQSDNQSDNQSVTGPPASSDIDAPPTPPKRTRRTRAAKAAEPEPAPPAADEPAMIASSAPALTFQPPSLIFQPPVVPPAEDEESRPRRASRKRAASAAGAGVPAASGDQQEPIAAIADAGTEAAVDESAFDGEAEDDEAGGRRRRRRGGRGRGRRARDGAESDSAGPGEAEPVDETSIDDSDRDDADGSDAAPDSDSDDDEADGTGSSSSRRRRRRRRRAGSDAADSDAGTTDDEGNTVVHVREPRRERQRERERARSGAGGRADDKVTAIPGSTRLEARKQRRREGRESGRRRPPIITEAEFLARREAVDRVMVVRYLDDRTQIAVLEDGVLVEHYVAREATAGSASSYVGNVYLGKVQNVLPSMEAAFVDIGKGRNAVLYAGEVNWDAAGLEGQPRRIELALKSGDAVLVQVTKDPIGHKGARLTSQISLPGRFLVYVPDGSMTGISRKLPENERSRLKGILKTVVPEDAGVIVRTAAEGASEEELERDVARLAGQWDDIQRKAAGVSPPSLLHGEPDLTVRVVRDVFNEDFSSLVVSGDEAWQVVEPYVEAVAPDLAERVVRWEGEEAGDVFAAYRVDEQISKALDRKVWLPSGGSLVIDRTEAMTVVDVNTGRFTGQGGNLEETVTRNNLEAAEELVRQLRLRDIGGIIVVDFIDMVLESNRELVLRRLLECLGRDRTKHQVAEVTSLGLVQMTRKRVGQGLLDAFSETCECCNGRGVVLHDVPVEPKRSGRDNGSKDGTGDAEDRRRRAQEIAAATAAIAGAGSVVNEEIADAPEGSANGDDDVEVVLVVEVVEEPAVGPSNTV
jgi:ribonuclease E